MRDANKHEFPYALGLFCLAVCAATATYEAKARRYAKEAAVQICGTEGSLRQKAVFPEGGREDEVYGSVKPLESTVYFRKGIEGRVEQALITVAKNSRPAWHFLERTVDVTEEMTDARCRAIAGRNPLSGQRIAYASRHRGE